MRQFDRYVTNYFISSFCMAFLFLIGLYLMLDAMSRIDELLQTAELFPQMRASIIWDTFRYYVLTVPYTYLQYAPFIVLLAALFTGVRLSQNNELIPIVSSGVSLFRITVPLFVGAFLVAISMILVREIVIPRIDDTRDILRDRLLYQHSQRVFGSFRLIDEKGRSIRCGEFFPKDAYVQDIVINFREGDSRHTLQADVATYQNAEFGLGWYLQNGKETIRQGTTFSNPRTVEFLHDYHFTPQDLWIAFKGEDRPLDLSFSELNQLSLRNPQKSDFVTLLHYFITFPLAALILPLLGLPFVLRFERRAITEGIIISMLIFFLYFGVDFYLRGLGNQEILHPLMASWLPTVMFGSLGIVIFESIRS